MPDNTTKEFNRLIESGEYFSDARSWYIRKYLGAFVERTFLIMLVFLFGTLLSMTYSYHEKIQPIIKSLPIRVYVPDSAEFYSKIKYLGNDSKDFNINDEVIKFFAGRFVTAWTEYDWRDNFALLKRNKTLIEYLASNYLNLAYQEKISLRGRNSLVSTYRKTLIKKSSVRPRSLQVIEQDKNELNLNHDGKSKTNTTNYRVQLIYDVFTYKQDGTITQETFQGVLNLTFDKILFDLEKREYSDFNFTIYEFNSKKVTN